LYEAKKVSLVQKKQCLRTTVHISELLHKLLDKEIPISEDEKEIVNRFIIDQLRRNKEPYVERMTVHIRQFLFFFAYVAKKDPLIAPNMG
jgi:hypothetical protein